MQNFLTLDNKLLWIIVFGTILLLFNTYEKEDFAPLIDYPPDPLPTVSTLKSNYINNQDTVNDKYENILSFNKLFLPNGNLNKPVYLMARSNGRVRQRRLVN